MAVYFIKNPITGLIKIGKSDEYFDIGARYCQDKEDELNVPTLFDLKEI